MASTPGTLGTWRLISEGCTKMEAPMVIPTTMVVACSRPLGRASAAPSCARGDGDVALGLARRDDQRKDDARDGGVGGLCGLERGARMEESGVRARGVLRDRAGTAVVGTGRPHTYFRLLPELSIVL